MTTVNGEWIQSTLSKHGVSYSTLILGFIEPHLIRAILFWRLETAESESPNFWIITMAYSHYT